MKPKRVYFFRDDQYLRYDSRADTVDNNFFPADIAPAWTGLANSGFDTGFDAVLNGGNGFIYFFKEDQYLRYDPRRELVDIPARPISQGWPALATFGFDSDLDTCLYYRDNKVLFFQEDKYLRYNMSDDTVDQGYQKSISAGWSNIGQPFTNGIDATVNFGEGKAYFFAEDQYIRINIAANAVDPNYPLDIAQQWPALVPAGYTVDLTDTVEWPYCEVELFDVQLDPLGCQEIHLNPGELFPQMRAQREFAMVARFTAQTHPADCRCGEYRQLVRGDFRLDGQRLDQVMGNPDGGPSLHLLARPPAGAANDNFLEDSLQKSTTVANLRYGHRDELPGNPDITDRYLPERATGCEYRGFDFPFLDGRPGQDYVIDLDFCGLVVDLCNRTAGKPEELGRKTWTVTCLGTYPTRPSNPRERSRPSCESLIIANVVCEGRCHE